MRIFGRFLAVIGISIVTLLLLFGLAAFGGSTWLSTAENAPKAGEPERKIYVLSNGFHTDVVLPLSSALSQDGLPVNEDDLPGGFEGVEYLVVGWGSEAAYTNIGPLSDLTLGLAAKALAFDKSVMHVLPIYGPPNDVDGVYPLHISERAYQRLLDFISGTFERSPDGSTILLSGVSQGYGDVFFKARPRFSAFYGCNAWVGEALREAGVAMGRWTPFAQSVEWGLNKSSPSRY